MRTDTSSVTEEHKKLVANQKEAERKAKEEDLKRLQSRKSMEEIRLNTAKSYLLNGIPPKKVAKIMGMELSQVKELQKSIKK